MSTDQQHSTESARAAAERGELGKWVKDFLASPGSDNAELAEQLGQDGFSWLGPIEVPLDDLHRLAGPPGAPVLEEWSEDEWRDDVDDLAAEIKGGHEPAPVVASYTDDQLVLEDGNHRVEALRRAGAETAWAVIGFEDAGTRDRFIARSGPTAG